MLYFWTKVLHITAMTVWFTGLFFLPRLFIAQARADGGADATRLHDMARTLYFWIMTPAALLTIWLGLGLIGFGFEGVWLPAKLVIVSMVVMIHLYYGQLLLDLTQRKPARHSLPFYHLLNWTPLVLVLAIAALTAAKPGAIAPLG